VRPSQAGPPRSHRPRPLPNGGYLLRRAPPPTRQAVASRRPMEAPALRDRPAAWRPRRDHPVPARPRRRMTASATRAQPDVGARPIALAPPRPARRVPARPAGHAAAARHPSCARTGPRAGRAYPQPKFQGPGEHRL